jgi:protein-disulfide isomerase
MSSSSPKPTRSQQREEAREQAKKLREQNKRKDFRTKLLIQVSVVAVAVAIVGGTAGVIVGAAQNAGENTISPDGAPANMAFDNGIKIGTGLRAFTETTTPTPSEGTEIPEISVWVDYQCPFCQFFDLANTAQIRSLVDTGAATLTIHPISFLDRASLNQYSSRAANAAACVASFEPDSFFDMHTILMEQPTPEGGDGHSDEVLFEFASLAGAGAAEVQSCITSKAFGEWIEQTTANVLSTPRPGSGISVTSTPTVLVNGQQYPGEPSDSAAFLAFFQLVTAQ